MIVAHPGQIDQIDHLDPDLPLRRTCTAQVQPSEVVLDHADFTTPTCEHEVDTTDQESTSFERSRS